MAKDNNTSTALAKLNYKIMAIGAIVTIIGFLLMVGGGSKNPNVYNPAVYSFRRITLAPFFVLLGYAVVLYGILKKPKEEADK